MFRNVPPSCSPAAAVTPLASPAHSASLRVFESLLSLSLDRIRIRWQ